MTSSTKKNVDFQETLIYDNNIKIYLWFTSISDMGSVAYIDRLQFDIACKGISPCITPQMDYLKLGIL